MELDSIRLISPDAAPSTETPQIARAYLMSALVALFVSLYTGNNLLYLFVGAVIGLFVLGATLSWLALTRVRTRRVPAFRAVSGEGFHVRFQVTNSSSWLPAVGLEIEDSELGVDAPIPALGPGESTWIELLAPSRPRGAHTLSGYVVATSFPFGLIRPRVHLDAEGELIVWPRIGGAHRSPETLPTSDQDEDAGLFIRRTAKVGSEYHALRDYLPGDDPRLFHWKASARLSRPIVRELIAPHMDEMWVELPDPMPQDEHEVEELIEAAAGILKVNLESGHAVGLRTLTDSLRVEPARGRSHLEHLFDELARYEPPCARGGQDPPGGVEEDT